MVFQFHFYLSLFHALHFISILACIFCVVHDLGALGVARNIQVMDSLQINDLFTTVRGSRQPIGGYSALSLNWKDDWSYLSG